MRKFGVTLALIAASFALVASTAEAAKTSEKEGRKYSRKYVNAIVRDGEIRDLGWEQRDCYRIGRRGVGLQRSFPRGVACLFSSKKRGPACFLLGVAVKDGKRYFQAEAVTTPFPYHGDPADCKPDAPYIEWPPLATWAGIVGEPLRPTVSSARERRPPCQKRVDGVLRTIGFSGRTGRLNISCRKAARIMKRYILHKKLPGQWYCSHLGASFGKCVDEKELYSEECAGREQRCVSSFNYAPGQRA